MAFLVGFSELCDWAILLVHGTVANVIIETFGGDLRSSIWAEVAAFWGINTCLHYITAQWGISLLLCNTGVPRFYKKVPRFSMLPGSVRYLV